ncbi:MAG: DUF3793 family protein [Vallitaleaceae bacterium]|nr:DUF3793 family protein [Vallitaleaceae bacterium]
MYKTKLMNLKKHSSNYSELEYLLYKIALHCAPTLMREKPSSLVCLKGNYRDHSLIEIWERWKGKLSLILPLSYYELSRCENHIVILFYHPDWMDHILNHEEIRCFLCHKGYSSCQNMIESLEMLRCRFKDTCPHEVGVFLGYPIKDVIEFNEDTQKEALAVGYWKVYNDLQHALETFKRYDHARDLFTHAMTCGMNPSKAIRNLSVRNHTLQIIHN